MSAHTKGPWAWDADGQSLRPVDDSNSVVQVIFSTDGMRVRRTDDINGMLAEIAANKALIAAAPAMLKALIVAREFISFDRNTLADCCTDFDGGMSDDDAAAVADYNAALLQIDAAIQEATRAAS